MSKQLHKIESWCHLAIKRNTTKDHRGPHGPQVHQVEGKMRLINVSITQ